MTSLRDVARRAGVSAITVSRVMNKSPEVRRGTRERVLTAAAALNYVPNGVARSLKRQRSDSIALVVTDIRNPFFTTLAAGAEEAARAAGLSLLLGDSNEDPAIEASYVQLIAERRADGMILVPASAASAAHARALLPPSVPLVLVARRAPGVVADSIRCDDRVAVAALVRHLLSLGRQRIAIVGGTPGMSTWEERVAGYSDALLAVGQSVEPQLIVPGNYRADGGEAAVAQLLKQARRPDAIIAGSARTAIGVLNELAAQHLRVPDDMSVAAINDPLPEVRFGPRLTVVQQPVYEMGKAAVEAMVARLRGIRTDPTPWQVVFDARLCIGTSCGELQATTTTQPGQTRRGDHS